MTDSPAKPFDLSPLSTLAPMLADMLVLVANDVALVLDANGVIENVVPGGSDPEAVRALSADWLGRSLQDTVTAETRVKIEELVRDVSANGVSKQRQVTHTSEIGPDVPYAYTAVRLGQRGPLLAVGRDLRTVQAMQQRFVNTQQEMERHYWKMRQAESRYQLLFQLATDAVMVIDTATLKITDANQAAARLFAMPAEQLAGKSPRIGVEPEFGPVLDGLLTSALAAGRSTEARVRLANGGHPLRVSAAPHNAPGSSVLLLRASLVVDQMANPAAESTLAALAERTQDAIVITDQHGLVTMANPAFAALLELDDVNQAVGRPLSGWLNSTDHSVAQTIGALLQNGVVPLFASGLRGENGRGMQVEVSATLLPSNDGACVGFIMRTRTVVGTEIVTNLASRRVH